MPEKKRKGTWDSGEDKGEDDDGVVVFSLPEADINPNRNVITLFYAKRFIRAASQTPRPRTDNSSRPHGVTGSFVFRLPPSFPPRSKTGHNHDLRMYSLCSPTLTQLCPSEVDTVPAACHCYTRKVATYSVLYRCRMALARIHETLTVIVPWYLSMYG